MSHTLRSASYLGAPSSRGSLSVDGMLSAELDVFPVSEVEAGPDWAVKALSCRCRLMASNEELSRMKDTVSSTPDSELSRRVVRRLLSS